MSYGHVHVRTYPLMPWDPDSVIYDGAGASVVFSKGNSKLVFADDSAEDGGSATVLSADERGEGSALLYAEQRIRADQDMRINSFFGLDENAFVNFSMQPEGGGAGTDILAGVSGYGYQSAEVITVPFGEEFVLQYLIDFTLGRGWLGVNNAWFKWSSFDPPGDSPGEDEYFEFSTGTGFKLGLMMLADVSLVAPLPYAVLAGFDGQFAYAKPAGSVEWGA